MTIWPKQNDLSAMHAMFGNPDANNDGAADLAWARTWLVTITPAYPLFYAGKPVLRITVNKAIAAPVSRVLAHVASIFPDAGKRKALGIDQFDGCFNFRAKRGGHSLSMHSYAIALDFNAARNPFRTTHNDMPEAFVKAWQDEGAEWGGLWSAGSRDPMHFQFARTH